MPRGKPKPIRLTKRRAEALIAAANRGLDEWEDEIAESIHDAEAEGNLRLMRDAKALDEKRADAIAAVEIVTARYVGKVDSPAHPTLDI